MPERGDHLTNIQGTAQATTSQMQSYIKRVNPKVAQSVINMIPYYISEGEAEGIRGDIAFAQSCLETGNFTFSGSAVTLDQNNFAGIGVTSNGMNGESWSTPQEGIRAQIQHLKAYATNSPLNNVCVDKRYKYVDKGCAPYVEWLGIQENPKKKGWAAGTNYGIKILNIIDAILKEGTGDTHMRINVHAGHNIASYTACGAVGLINESIEDRKVKDEVIRQLRALGHTVYDCTIDRASSVSNNLSQIVSKCNEHTVDLDISIHFNSGANDTSGNGTTTGAEVWVYGNGTKVNTYAEKVCQEISKLGFRNRGIKSSTGLYVLKHTKSPAMLIECCFVDDRDDVNIYNANYMANAIVKGITGKSSAVVPTDSPRKNYLAKGDRGDSVKTLQRDLNVFLSGDSKIKVDGDFGTGTEDAVKLFQSTYGLSVDGCAGVNTQNKIKTILSNDSWIRDIKNKKWWFRHKDGSYKKAAWEKINGTWYYFDTNGWMKTGWLQVDSKWYLLKSSGAMAHDELVKVGNELYYFLSDGHMARTNDRGALV